VKTKRIEQDHRPKSDIPPRAAARQEPGAGKLLWRLQRILAHSGLASRRKAEDLIRTGRVVVDGRVVTELGLKLVPSDHRIEVDGKLIPPPESKTYYLFYKPKGVVSSLKDPQGRPTIFDYLSQSQIQERVFPVGRLDWDAEGLMLLTNDGELAQSLQHPKFQVPKTYRVKVRGIPTLDSLRRLQAGTWLPSGKRHQAQWEMVKTGIDRSWLLITIREGEKHQVKNMCAAIGHPLMAIKRITLGPLSLGRLAPGAIRPLTQKEIETFKREIPV
jgi:23S rRNA pseudouridine2605 synthase